MVGKESFLWASEKKHVFSRFLVFFHFVPLGIWGPDRDHVTFMTCPRFKDKIAARLQCQSYVPSDCHDFNLHISL